MIIRLGMVELIQASIFSYFSSSAAGAWHCKLCQYRL